MFDDPDLLASTAPFLDARGFSLVARFFNAHFAVDRSLQVPTPARRAITQYITQFSPPVDSCYEPIPVMTGATLRGPSTRFGLLV